MRRAVVFCVLTIIFSTTNVPATTNGDVLIGASAVNLSMGGAGIATSIDAIGSCYNNASSIAFVPSSSGEFNMDLFTPHRSMYASIPGAAAGSVTSQTDQTIIPAMGLVYDPADHVVFGLCAVGVGGFGVNYPAVMPNATGQFNPLVVPQNMRGFGSIYSNLQYMQVTPTVAYRLTPRFSLGAGLDVDWQSLQVSPFAATAPNASGYPVSSPASSSFGIGFTLGATYRPTNALQMGVVFKSPQWMQSMHYLSQYPDGTPANFNFTLNFPMIVGAGVSYKITPKLLVAVDERWIDFADTTGFQGSGFGPSGAIQGFGWHNIYATATGFQYELNHRLTLRGGYNHSGSPIASNQQFFNVFAPGIVQDSVASGLGIRMSKSIMLDVVYLHGFSNSASGPVYSGNMAIPGSVVRNQLSEDEFSAQFRLLL